MNDAAYHIVREAIDGVGYRKLSRALIKLSGRDRLSFLQGQVTQDVVSLTLGSGARAAMLNSTGHLVAELTVYAFADEVVIETDLSCASVVAQTLDRYLIREKVRIEDVTSSVSVVTVQGGGTRDMLGELGLLDNLAQDAIEYSHGDRVFVRKRRLGAAEGFDVWGSSDVAAALAERAVEIDDETYEALRIEAGQPKWGAELDESVIPLEAGMLDAISFAKGCYVGQEIIARIKSRGHTNRTLRQLVADLPVDAGAQIVAIGGSRAGEAVGRVTSSAVSPSFGPVALGYIRNEYADEETELSVDGHRARVRTISLPG